MARRSSRGSADDESEYAKVREEAETTKIRYSASKVSAVVGLHEFGNPVEDFMEILYQDLEELLEIDAKLLGMKVVSKYNEMKSLIQKSGARKILNDIVKWTHDKSTTARVGKANSLSRDAINHINAARKRKRLTEDEAKLLQESITTKVRQSVGKRNENLALQMYEAQNGLQVESTNDKFYFLLFPHPKQAKAVASSSSPPQCSCYEAKRMEDLIERFEMDKNSDGPAPQGHYFSICGMIDGVADVLTIDDDDVWSTERILVEVKNRMARFKNPTPLHDCIQMAVYMKMIGVRQGDMVQCLHHDKTVIQVARVSLDEYPLSSSAGQCPRRCSTDLWTSVIVPRLYEYSGAIYKLRGQDMRRLAFLQAAPDEQLKILRDLVSFV
ncbi:unnamed protein product [Aphanomyces euteiches]|nr:hypothetical protein AeRB84_002761 [Aphanomyces euteiches]